MKDPFEEFVATQGGNTAARVGRADTSGRTSVPHGAAAVTCRLHGFDLDERPLISDMRVLPGEILAARTTVRLLSRMVGSRVAVVLEEGDPRRPIIIGVIQEPSAPEPVGSAREPLISLQVDDDRLVLSAEREIVLSCGQASIVLTRAGKVIIKGSYVLSRSTGVNKLKGAAIDIN